MLAGLIVAGRAGLQTPDVLRSAVAAGTADVLCHSPGRIPREVYGELLERVRVEEVRTASTEGSGRQRRARG